MTTVRQLVTRLGFDADTREARQYDQTLADVRRTAMRAAAAVGALGAATFELARRMANSGNEVAKSALEAGMAADEYQRLRFALGQVSQASSGEVDRALGRLNQRIGRARREGGKYADALMDMGFSQREIESGAVTSEMAMDRLTQQIAGAGSAAEASAMAGDILGTRLGRRLGPALFENAEAMQQARIRAEELGGGWSDAALSASEDFVDSMGEVSLIATTITSQIAEQLVPAVNAIIDSFVEWWAANREIIQQNIGRVLERLGMALRAVQSVVMFFVDAIDAAAQAVGGWERVVSLLTAALTVLIGMRVARWVWAVSAALIAATRAGRGLRLVLLALNRIPVIAAFTALVLLLEDMYHWVTGNDSVLGDWLGTWDDFADKVAEVARQVRKNIDNMIPEWFRSMVDRRALPFMPGFLPGLAETMQGPATPQSPTEGGPMAQFRRDEERSQARRSAGGISINEPATVNVPAGTSEEQRQFLETTTADLFQRHWNREIRNALRDMEPVD